jgi:hypothetical protein
MIRTPCVLRPCILMSRTGILITFPFWLVTRSSSSSQTLLIAIPRPFRRLGMIVMIPFPPRLVTRYSSNSVRFPYPFSAQEVIETWP